MDTLHRHGYDLGTATCSLVPSTGPVLCRDEMEEWSASEANLFEEALEKYGKDFGDIRHDFVSISYFYCLYFNSSGYCLLYVLFVVRNINVNHGVTASMENAQKHS